MRSSPSLTRRMIDYLHDKGQKNSYTSGVLAFAPEHRHKVTPEVEKDILNRFEAVAFAGLAREQVNYLAVRHPEGIHVVIPRGVFTYTPGGEPGRITSFNAAPPGKVKQNTFDAMRNTIDARYGFASPDDPAQARHVRLSDALSLSGQIAQVKGDRTTAKARDDIKLLIREYVRGHVEQGRVHSRDDVVDVLKEAGMQITRQHKNYITVLDPASGDRFRMKGALFDAEHFNPEARDVPTIPHRSDIARTAELEEKLNRFIEHRAAYNRQRYGNPPEPPENDNRATSPTPSLGHFLRCNLGSLAIEPVWEDLGLRGVRVKQHQYRRRRIIHRNAALGTSWVEEVVEPEAER